MNRVTVRLLGESGGAASRRVVTLELPPGATARDLLTRLQQELTAAGLAEGCLVAVNGTDVRHLGGWETPLPAGAVVSIVPPMLGG